MTSSGIWIPSTQRKMKRIDKATILGINAEKDLDTAGGTPSGKRITQLCSTNNCKILTQNIATKSAVNIPLEPKYVVAIANSSSTCKIINPINEMIPPINGSCLKDFDKLYPTEKATNKAMIPIVI